MTTWSPAAEKAVENYARLDPMPIASLIAIDDTHGEIRIAHHSRAPAELRQRTARALLASGYTWHGRPDECYFSAPASMAHLHAATRALASARAWLTQAPGMIRMLEYYDLCAWYNRA